MQIEQAYNYLYISALIIIGLCLICVIIKSIIGPRMTDRIVTINMGETLIVSIIAILATYLVKETYLIDISIIYVLISFVSVIVLTNVFINRFLEKKKRAKNKENKKDGMD